MRLLVKNIGMLATPEGRSARKGAQQGEIRILRDAWVLIRDGVIDQVPMFVVADLGSGGTLEEVRLYTHSSFVPHLTPYRRPLFEPAHLEKIGRASCRERV